jgi:hypothetical protein
MEDNAELIKWWDPIEALFDCKPTDDPPLGLQLARHDRDAQWLASLFPAEAHVDQEGMRSVLGKHGDDARAVFLSWVLSDDDGVHELLARASEMGYAPAQARMAMWTKKGDSFELPQRAAASGDRDGMFYLEGCSFSWAAGARRTPPKHWSSLLNRQTSAQERVAMMKYGDNDWEKFHLLSLAASRGFGERTLYLSLPSLVPSFEAGEKGRILHTVAPLIRKSLSLANKSLFGYDLLGNEPERLQRIVELHDAMLDRARRAIACWSVAGQRCGVAKDIRVLISKMAWEEAWKWSAKV